MIADELSQNDIDSLLGGLGGDDQDGGTQSAEDALSALAGGDDSGGDISAAISNEGGGTAVSLPEFEEAQAPQEVVHKIEDLLGNVNIKVKIRLGKTMILVEDLLKLNPGKVIQLDSVSGDPVDIMVNDRVVAKGEVIILNEAFCVRVTEIFAMQEKLERQN